MRMRSEPVLTPTSSAWARIPILTLAICLGGMPSAISAMTDRLVPSNAGGFTDSTTDLYRNPTRALVQAAPVAPNESRITGEVLELDPVDSSVFHMQPPQVFMRIRLRLLSIRSVGTMPSPLQGREGQTLEVLSREFVESKLVGKVISGTVVFRGDERGGMYWIFDVQSAAQD